MGELELESAEVGATGMVQKECRAGGVRALALSMDRTLCILHIYSITNNKACRFHLKFQQIVDEEQELNFISRLHNGDLMIIPWPVIESRRFYTLYNGVKKLLDRASIHCSLEGGRIDVECRT